MSALFLLTLLAFQVYGFKQPIDKPIIEGEIHDFGPKETVTFTVYSTLDSFTTLTNKHYNSVPLTITEFSKYTVTVPTREVVRTQVDDIVRISTVQITRTGTETVTDVFSMHKCATETSTELVTVTHLNQNVLQTTITRTSVSTLTFRPTIVQTVIATERQIET
ncbi:hypothetical protein Anas_14172 [Armadillidium nasatum]|uniref:Uncharacterized protein n=1 Tax=Armadillidium nasatum TaxID=96803 RepID=A0A5N5TBS4_9CRUS|nr:hypothetical protein Anas_14172 [Armadillidium nasatum]